MAMVIGPEEESIIQSIESTKKTTNLRPLAQE